MSIKKHLAIISHSNSGKVAEIRANLKRLGVAVPHDLRSRAALESIAVAMDLITKAWDDLPTRPATTKS